MKDLLDASWRALAYCLHPRVLALSLPPLVVGGALLFALGWWFWVDAIDGVRSAMENWSLVEVALQWVERIGGASLRAVVAPLIVVLLAQPLVVMLSVLLVSRLMTPAIVRLIAARRFPQLQRRGAESGEGRFAVAVAGIVAALSALIVTMPLWFIPPLMLVLPPLIWGWFAAEVSSHDVLAQHAAADERRVLLRRHRRAGLAIGLIAGYLSALPMLFWGFSATSSMLAPLLMPLSVWLYVMAFAFAALWQGHFALRALQRHREHIVGDEQGDTPGAGAPDATTPASPAA